MQVRMKQEAKQREKDRRQEEDARVLLVHNNRKTPRYKVRRGECLGSRAIRQPESLKAPTLVVGWDIAIKRWQLLSSPLLTSNLTQTLTWQSIIHLCQRISQKNANKTL